MHAVSSASARARADGGRSRSAVVSPSLRRPSSSPACLTHLRIALAEASNSRANCAIGRPARANSMIRRRYSSAYGGWVLGIGGLLLPFSPTPSTKAGQLQAVHLKPAAVLPVPRVAVRLAVVPRLPPAVAVADTDFGLPSGMTTASLWEHWPSG